MRTIPAVTLANINVENVSPAQSEQSHVSNPTKVSPLSLQLRREFKRFTKLHTQGDFKIARAWEDPEDMPTFHF